MTSTVSQRSAREDGAHTTPVVMMNGSHSGGFDGIHVHAEGCRDLKQRRYQHREYAADLANPVEIASVHEVVDEWYGPGAGSFYEEAGYVKGTLEYDAAWSGYRGEFHIFPCLILPDEARYDADDPKPEPARRMTNLDAELMAATSKRDGILKDLREAATALQDKMTRLVACTQAEPVKSLGGGLYRGINSLGEVQTYGTTVDRLCILLDAQDALVATLTRHAEEAAK